MAGRRNPGILCTAGMEARLGPEDDKGRQRFAAEVVVRRRDVKKKEKVENIVEIDLKAACNARPAKRLTWLTHACKMAQEGRASSAEIFNIITTRRFASGVSRRLGKGMVEVVEVNMALGSKVFSEKQQRHLRSSEWLLNNVWGNADLEDGEAAEGDDSESEKEPEPPEPEPPRAGRETSRAAEAVAPKVGRETIDKVLEERRQRPFTEPAPVERLTSGWVTVERREAPEDQSLRKAKERLKEEKQKQQEEEQKKQAEEAADSSLRMLDSLFGGNSSPPRSDPYASYGGNSRRHERSRSRRRKAPRGRSRSVSVQEEPRSPPRREKQNKLSFEEALRRRMQQREATDTTRDSIVQENYRGKAPTRLKFESEPKEHRMPRFPGSALSLRPVG